MNKYEPLLDYFDWLVVHCEKPVKVPEDVKEIYNELKNQNVNKPLLTDSGLQILEYLQGCDTKNLKAKDIAEGMDVPSRKISGSMRKLVTDGFVEKSGQNPVIYNLTEKGLNFDIEDYKTKNEGE